MDVFEIIDYVKFHKSLPSCDFSDINAALITAVERGDMEAVKLFVSNKVSLNETYWTPLNAAIEKNKNEIAAYLIENGANVKIPQYDPPYVQSIMAGNAYILELILKTGINPNIGTYIGEHLISISVLHKKIDCMKVLLSYGATLNQLDISRILSSNWVKGLKVIIENGVTLELNSSEVLKYILKAAEKNHYDMMIFLYQNFYSPTKIEPDVYSMEEILRSSSPIILSFLLDQNTDIIFNEAFNKCTKISFLNRHLLDFRSINYHD